MAMILPPVNQIDFTKGCPIIFQFVEVAFCNIIEPHEGQFGMGWKICIVLTPEEASWLTQVGKKVVEETQKDAAGNAVPTGRYLLYLETKCLRQDGTANKPPMYVGADGRTSFPVDCGRGSTVTVNTCLKKTAGGFPLYLNSVQVIYFKEKSQGNLVDYTADPTQLPAAPEGATLALPDTMPPATPAGPGAAAPATPAAPGAAPGMMPPASPAPAAPAGPGAAAPAGPPAQAPAATPAAPATPPAAPGMMPPASPATPPAAAPATPAAPAVPV